jgi:hypothetical protein
VKLLIILYFLIIITLSLFKRKKINSPSLNFFKSLFPSWKFFDESVDTPVLLWRLYSDPDNHWQVYFPPPEKKWFNLFYNSEGNFYLAYHSHIQQLLGELSVLEDSAASEFHHHSAYKITENFVRSKKPTGDFQFKISSIKYKEDHSFIVIEDILISPRLKVVS